MASTGAANHGAEEEVFVLPASFAQQRLWLVDQLAAGAAYNVPTILRCSGVLNLAALEASFNKIVQRHEVLRTTFSSVEGQPVQVITPHLQVSLPLIDLQFVAIADREPEAKRLIWQEIQQPFDLVRGPLLRLLLLRLHDTEHVLVVNLHHIVFDEWSIALLIQELGALYTAFVTGTPASLPDLPIQYADFAQWQREWLQGEVLEFQQAYWRQQLQDLTLLELPGQRSRSGDLSDRGQTQQVEISQAMTEALKQLSDQQGVTLFMTLLAAFQAFLSRYSGQTDIAVGSPIANRNRRELEDLIGFFANSLVLRTDLSGNPIFRELLDRVRQVTLGAYAHQDLPFEKLVATLHPDRDVRRNPLFQVVFALQNAPMQQLALPELTLRSFPVEITTARFDLEFYLWECSENFRSLWGQGWQQSEGLRGVLVYRADQFEPETIVRMVQHFQILLAGAVANPDTRLSDLPLLSEAEQQQILVEWNQTQRDYPADLGIHQQFEQQVAQSPQAIAIQFGEQQFTYQALNRGSNQLAHYLRAIGVKRGTIVGVCLESSAAMVATFIGVLKAGGAYLPLDPNDPPERLRLMLEDADVAVVLTQQNFAGSIEQWQSASPNPMRRVVYLDQEWPLIAQASEANLLTQTQPDQIAYVIYTSGSTGVPKGVAVPHRAVNRLVCNANYITITSSDRVAQVANPAFDAATFEIWGALLNGARLVGIDRDTLLSPVAFATALQQQQISVLFLTTALFNQVAQEVPAAFRSLRYLLFGGEAVDVRWVRSVLEQGKPKHLLHVYGPTENTTFSCWYEVNALPEDAVTVPIGRPLSNTQVYLLDQDQQPVAIGVTGEIYLGGDGLACGYLHRPELTAIHFISNPYGSSEASRLYRTGDLARYWPDGNLEFLGRRDKQIKLRGFRIELGEIEAVLKQHAAVQDAVVTVQTGPIDDRRLVAYLVANRGEAVNQQELRSFFKTKLPDFMLPATWVFLDALPLTANGKVDRKALPAPDVAVLAERHLAPRTQVEAALGQIWIELLGAMPIGMDDNFFELGGHSLLATQLLSRVRQQFQQQVPLRYFFERPTIAGLAAYLSAIDGSERIQIAADQLQREEVEF